jgi:predicted O-methyltransferase YrrM
MGIVNKFRTLNRLIKNLDRIPAIEAMVCSQAGQVPPAEDSGQNSQSDFAGSLAAIPFYHGGKTLYPGGKQPARVVPLDGEYVIADPLSREPYQWLMKKLDQDIETYQKCAESIKTYSDFSDLPSKDIDGITAFHPNNYFGPTDSAALTHFLATKKPERYIEIGSGHSTRFARRAVKKYELNTDITCIDPNPRSKIAQVSDTWIEKSLLDVDLSIFSQLKENDILMLDGSHLSLHGTDTVHFFLRIIPMLQPGVIIHLHDIFLPYEYPERCDHLYWTEQYMLGVYLLDKPASKILAPIQYMYEKGLCEEGVSFWYQT